MGLNGALCVELVEDDTSKHFITVDVRAVGQESFHKKDFVFWNRADYRGFPSKGYSVFFQRPHEQLTENNGKLGSSQSLPQILSGPIAFLVLSFRKMFSWCQSQNLQHHPPPFAVVLI